MEIGETVVMVQQLMDEGKCVICGSSTHNALKKEEIKEVASVEPKSKWGRKSMSKVFDWTEDRKSIYRNGAKPRFATQGHHCLALSSLVEGANTGNRKDRRLRLNHFLKEVGFHPNRKQNCILLPTRRSNGDFDAFWTSLDDDKPLQMHGPGHDDAYFTQCDRLLSFMIMLLTDPEICEQQTMDDWKDDLKELVKQAENYGFVKLASNALPWRLHPSEQVHALRLYFMPSDHSMELKGARDSTKTVSGLGRKPKEITFPTPNLDMGPFGDH